MRPQLCIDIDNVIAESDTIMREVISSVTEGRVNLSHQEVVAFRYQDCRDSCGERISDDEWKKVHEEFSTSKRILAIQPCNGVQQHLRELAETFDLHLATSRLRKARTATIEWLDANGFDVQYDLHFVRSGQKHFALGRFVAAIEDEAEQAEAFANAGTRCFVLARPWNSKIAASQYLKRVDDWQDLRTELSQLVARY